MGDFDELPLPPDSPSWNCFGAPVQPRTGENIQIEFQVGNHRQELVTDVKVRACSSFDANCDDPAFDTRPNAEGLVAFTLPGFFRGYFEVVHQDFVEATAGKMGPYLPTIVIFPLRELQRGTAGRGIYMFPPETATGLLGAAGVSYAVDEVPNAILTSTALDCQGTTTPGVTFFVEGGATAPDEAITFYMDVGLFALPPEQRETTEAGLFVQPKANLGGRGAVTLEAFINPLGRRLGSDRSNTSALVRDNWVTTVFVSPP